MGTAAALRRDFNRTLGIPPDVYRRTFHDDHDAPITTSVTTVA
jgi:hypothetical protein